ncbi:MAG: inner-membrane translocator [Spirochaetes bacterium GWF1_51_8]|nr:MAG: inner-membrane translocator [Spirochaetes bacterium GWF1_51_8]
MAKFLKDNGTLLAMIALGALLSIISDTFRSPENFSNLVRQMCITGIVAVGMTMVILLGGIDLSVGSIAALAGVEIALLMQSGVNIWLAIVIMLLTCGLLLGLWNGFWIAKFQVPAFIITLGMMTIARGLAHILTGGTTPSIPSEDYYFIGNGYIPKEISIVLMAVAFAGYLYSVFAGIARKKRYEIAVKVLDWLPRFITGILAFGFSGWIFIGTSGIPVPVALMGVIVFLGHFMLTNTRFGRKIYAIGGNQEAARLSGINVFGVKLGVYTIVTVLSAVAGIVASSRLSSASPNEGNMLELDVIAAVVIGGTSLSGGVGTIFGAIVGALFIQILKNGMSILSIQEPVQNVVKGFIIIFAVLFDVIQKKRRTSKAKS